MSQNKTDLPPQDIPFGQNNAWIRTKRPTVTDSELERKRREEHTNPDVSKEVPGPLLGIALENSFDIKKGEFPIEFAGSNYENADKLIAVKAQIIEQDRVPHPADKDLKYEDGTPISEEAMLFFFDTFIAVSTDVKEHVNKGDYILVDYENRLTRSGPKYYGLKYKGSKDAGKKEDKSFTQQKKEQANLQNTTSPPNVASPVPAATQTPPANTTAAKPGDQFQCGKLAALEKTPGNYPVVPAPYEMVEMAVIPNTAFLIFPKKYINALQTMRAAYEKETGQKMGLTSAYRSVTLQQCMYDRYIATGRPWPPVGDPSKIKSKFVSAHVTGRAVDLATLKPYNGQFKTLSETKEYNSLKKPDKRDLALEKTKNGDFGPIAQWLVKNSERFGFVWSGWNFQELWHYDFVEEIARKAGLIE